MALSIKRSQLGWFLAGGVILALAVSMLTPKPDVADYSNVLLVPELAEALDIDLAARIHLAHLGSSLVNSLNGDARDPLRLERYGAEATEFLSGEQRMAFAEHFRAGEIIPVTFQATALTYGWRSPGTPTANRSLHETRDLLDSAHEWIADEQVALGLLGHESDAVNSAAARWLNVNSARHRGVVSRARQEFREKAVATGGLRP